MSHNAYVRPGGIWNSGIVVQHGEFAAFDAAQFKSINGDDGGTWAPSSLITIGGAGMQVLFGGDSQLPSGTTLGVSAGAQLTVNGTLSVPGTAVFNIGSVGQFYGSSEYKSGSTIIIDVGATQTVNGVFTTITGSVSTFGGSAIFNGTAAFNGVTSFTNNADFSGPVNIHGSALAVSAPTTLSGAVTLSGATSLAAPMTGTGQGRVVKRVIQSTSSSITTVGPHNCDTLIITSLPSGGSVTIDDTGAQDGDELRVVNLSSTHLATVLEPDGVTTILSLQNNTGNRTGATFIRAGGTWQWLPGDGVN